MTKISKALTAATVIAYHETQLVSTYERYYSEGGVGRWFGREAEAFGFAPGSAVGRDEFARLANGQDPRSGYQLIGWQGSAVARWIEKDSAWGKHIEQHLAAALQSDREIFRLHAGGEKLPRSKAVLPVEPVKQPRSKAVLPVEPVKQSQQADSPQQAALGDVDQTTTGLQRRHDLLNIHAAAQELYAHNLWSDAGAACRMYLKERGIRPDTAKELGLGLALSDGRQLLTHLRGLGYSEELLDASGLFARRRDEQFLDRFRDRVMFPIADEAGNAIAFGGRKAPGSNQEAKYINSPETELYKKSGTLYNLSRAAERIAETDRVVVVEGFMDVAAAHQAGVHNVVATCGTAMTQDQAKKLCVRASTAILNYDPDEAGRTATEKNAIALLDAGMYVRALDIDRDPADWIPQNGVKEYRRVVREVAPLVSYLSDRAREKFELRTADGLFNAEGHIDAMRWLKGILEHVQPQHRERVSAEFEAHLQIPKLPVDEQTPAASEHRAAWDITYSAPKSFSLTALVGGDDRLLKAWDAAVIKGAGYFERALQVKMGGDNAPETTQRMVSATFRHDTARPVNGYMAPQLHTHQVLFNMSMDQQGQHRAVEPSELYKLQGSADAVVMNDIALAAKACGYRLKFGRNMSVEIEGYTDEYLRAESPRRAVIEAKQEELGEFGPTASGYIAQNTREEKLDLSAEQVRQTHLDHAAEYGNQPFMVVADAHERKGITYSEAFRAQVADEGIQFAKQCLSERTTVMEWHEIHRHALRFGRGYIAIEDVEAAFERCKTREFKEVTHWRPYAPEHRYTTPELEQKEREILDWMASGRGRCRAIAGGITKDEFRERFHESLNNDQKWLVWKVIHGRDRMLGVQGLAGSGKTRCLATVQEFAFAYGFEVRGIAATSTAVAELRGVGINAKTLAAFELDRSEQHGPRLYLLDEASLTDVHQMSAFLRKLTPADRLLVIGDTKQHASLGAGAVFKQLQEAGMETYHLRKIMRQRPENYREVVKHVSKGEIRAALEKLDDDCRIHELTDERLRHRAIAMWYMNDPLHTLVVTPDNRSAAAISEAIRAERQLGECRAWRILHARTELTTADLRFAGNYHTGDVIEYSRRNESIGIAAGTRAQVVSVSRDTNQVTVMVEADGRIVTYDPKRAGGSATLYEAVDREFSAGERVQFTKALRLEGIANRALGAIERIDDAGNVVIKIDGREKLWQGNLEQFPHIDWGYVHTSYRVQSLTAENVLVHIDTDAPNVARMYSREFAYVAFSRGRQKMDVFTNARDELARSLTRSEEKPSALAEEEVRRYRGPEMKV